MLNSKKLAEMATRWRKTAAMTGRRRRTVPSPTSAATSAHVNTSTVAGRGHFVVYTLDGKRYEVPLSYLNTGVFREILTMSEEEFGRPKDGPIMLACDAAFMDHVLRSMGGHRKQFSRETPGPLCQFRPLYRFPSVAGEMPLKDLDLNHLMLVRRFI